MGFFSTIKNTFNKVTHAVGGFFHDAGSTISHDAHAVASTVETAVTTVYNDSKSGIKTVYNGGQKISNEIISGIKTTVDNTVNRTTGVLSMPLLLIGGGIAAFLLFSGKNSSFSASYNK